MPRTHTHTHTHTVLPTPWLHSCPRLRWPPPPRPHPTHTPARPHVTHVAPSQDLKPANVLLEDNDNPRVADFGISREDDGDDATMTKIGTPVGQHPQVMLGHRGWGRRGSRVVV